MARLRLSSPLSSYQQQFLRSLLRQIPVALSFDEPICSHCCFFSPMVRCMNLFCFYFLCVLSQLGNHFGGTERQQINLLNKLDFVYWATGEDE